MGRHWDGPEDDEQESTALVPQELPAAERIDPDEARWEREVEATAANRDPNAWVPWGLTYRQWKFIHEYLKDFNQTKAAERAGFSKKSAGQTGAALMRRPKVRRAMEWFLSERAREYSAEHGRIFQQLCAIAYQDPHDFVQWGQFGQATWTASKDIPNYKRSTVRKIKHTRREFEEGAVETIEIEFEPRLRAIELLMKATGMLRERESDDNRGAFAKWFEAQMSGEIPLKVRDDGHDAQDVDAEVLGESDEEGNDANDSSGDE